MIARAERVGLRVQEREHALALVVVHETPAEPCADTAKCDEYRHYPDGQPGHDDDEGAGNGDQGRRAEIGLHGHQSDRHQDDCAEHDQRCPRRRQRPFVHVPRTDHRYRELHQLGRLEFDDSEIEPALCAFADVTDAVDDDQ